MFPLMRKRASWLCQMLLFATPRYSHRVGEKVANQGTSVYGGVRLHAVSVHVVNKNISPSETAGAPPQLVCYQPPSGSISATCRSRTHPNPLPMWSGELPTLKQFLALRHHRWRLCSLTTLGRFPLLLNEPTCKMLRQWRRSELVLINQHCHLTRDMPCHTCEGTAGRECT
jgi:hypothetical protein